VRTLVGKVNVPPLLAIEDRSDKLGQQGLCNRRPIEAITAASG